MRHIANAVTAVLALGCRSAPVDESPISTDRPGFLFASSVVPRGVLQLEMATPIVTWTGSGDEQRTTSISAQARYGATDELELRLAATPYAHHPSDSDPDEGRGDLEVGAKYALPMAIPSVLVGTVRLPTDDHQFTSDDPAYSLHAVSETALAHGFGLKGMVGWSRVPDGSGGDLDSAALAILASHAIAGDVSGYVETAWFPALESGPDPAFAGLGVAYLLGLDAQLDAAVDAGLNEDAADWIATIGWSIRW